MRLTRVSPSLRRRHNGALRAATVPELSITVFCLDRKLRFVEMSRARSQASIQGLDSALAPISAIIGDDARFLAHEPDLLGRPTKYPSWRLGRVKIHLAEAFRQQDCLR
jgi:hypothetical protein